MSSVRVLIVEDFEPFRRFVASTLRSKPEVQIICEAFDGLTAVQKAEELKPDLIVLDIGLPTLNGIEAARRIRTSSPDSKILFLSQESSNDLAQEALSLGAKGYVVKEHAGSELLLAVEAVLQGDQFVSGGLSGHWFKAQSPRLRQETDLRLPPPRKGKTPRKHEARFYSDDASMLAGFTHFIESALEAGNAVILLLTESHRKSVLQRLQMSGFDISAAVEQGRFIPLDVAEMLSAFMVNNLPDPARFSKIVGDLLEAADKAASGKHPHLAACGECAPYLWAQGNPAGAIRMEYLWNEITKTYEVETLCGYVLKSSQREEEPNVYESICAEHSNVYSK